MPAYELAQLEAEEKAKEEGVLNDAQGVLVDVNSALSTGASSITLGELEIFQQKLHASRDSVLELKASAIRETLLNNIEVTANVKTAGVSASNRGSNVTDN